MKEIFYLEEFGNAVASMYVSAMVVVVEIYTSSTLWLQKIFDLWVFCHP